MIELRLPSFGADMDEATFVQWQAEEGQPVKRGDIACVVETQKGAIDVEVWQDGVLAKRVAEPGQRLPVGRLLAVIATEGEDWRTVAAQAVAQEPTALAAPPPPAAAAAPEAPRGATEGVRASPAARQRAQALGVDLPALAASLNGAPVTLADVEQAAAAAAPAPARSAAENMRAAIAAAMARSKREIPHYYLGCEIEVEAAAQWLERFNTGRPLAERVLFPALALRAIALALRETPQLVGRFVDGHFQPADARHLGVVTSLREGGLVVPTVHDADTRPLGELMTALTAALKRARSGQLRSSDLADSTITVSSLGELGTDMVFGVIYPPQVAIVGLGRVAPRPVVRDGQLAVARTMHVTLAADHRVSDGLIGARFLTALAQRLADPEGLQ